MNLSNISEDDREEKRKRSPLVTRREILFIVFLTVLSIPIVLYLLRGCKEHRDWVVSKQNLQAIGQAIQVYTHLNNEGLPPIAERRAEGIVHDRYGKPLIWASQVFGALSVRDAFDNPKLPTEWETEISAPGGQGESVPLGYGMLSALDTARLYEVARPSNVVLLAETICNGYGNSFDPLPIPGTPKDGFVIGYDDNNDFPTAKSNYVTRLAFLAENPSIPISAREPLHRGRGTLALTVDGSILVLRASDQVVTKSGTLPTGLWAPFR